MKDKEPIPLDGNKYSQWGEELILQNIFSKIGTTNKHAVEFGAGDGEFISNTKLLSEHGWTRLMMDGNPGSTDVHKEWITKDNIVELLAKYNTPINFDLLSIDLDGNDYWVLTELLKVYKPRVIVCEINCSLNSTKALTMEYNESFVWDGSLYYGMNYEAAKYVAAKNNYTIIDQLYNLNVFMVSKDLWNDIPEITIEHIQYYPHKDGTWINLK